MSSTFVRALLALLAACTLTLPSRPASAQGVDEFGVYGVRRGENSESPQDTAVELRFGRFDPDPDAGLSSTPFKDYFGDDVRFLIGAEVDWQLLRIPHFGSLGPGVGFGVTKFSGKARVTGTGAVARSDTRVWMLPVHLVAVARADVLSRDFGVPLVPYGKLGLGYGLWWSSDGSRAARASGRAGKGASYGLTYALGAMFLLDVLDPDDAASADGLAGINSSYVFAEWFRPQLDGFGANDVLDLSSSSWLFGVAVEM
jgi:hypothetical protein